MDTAPPAVHTLLEIRKYCPEVFSKIEVWVDGGIKRGTDVVKALALGAKGVGIGRAALYGLSVGGEEGVKRVLKSKQINNIGKVALANVWGTVLADETATAMRLLGVKTVSELGPQHVRYTSPYVSIFCLTTKQVNTSALTSRLFDGPSGLAEVEQELRPKL